MHDFILAKQISETLLEIAREKKLRQVRHVGIEIGSIALSHDGIPEHVDEVSVENLVFGLESQARGTIFEGAQFEVKKVPGNDWKIAEIEGE